MRFETRRASDDQERILPLINVVFLLLIFFMLAGRLASSDPLKIAPPVSGNGARAEAHDVLVSIAADGRIAVDGVIVEQADLGGLVLRHMSGSGRVHLRADGGIDAGRVIAVMELLRDIGVERLMLHTVPAAGR